MQQHQQYGGRQRPRLIQSSDKTRNDDFYLKLERVRLSAAASSSKQYPQRTATELLDESKALFVKSQEVLQNRQTLSNNQQVPPLFRTTQPPRSPDQDSEYKQDRCPLDLALRSSTPPTTNTSDSVFESISVLSLSDQTTLDSTNSPLPKKRTVVSSAVTIIERNARIIKWLFQLHKANELPSFQGS